MSRQTTMTLSPPLNPFKRVKYSMGLILGVDEFEQEQRYLMHRDELHTRLLHGYGTICGLRVSLTETEEGLQVQVEPGAAVDTHGRHICIEETQCASLDAWLERHRETLSEESTFTPPGTLPLHVVLCYRECETDNVPVPAAPCSSQTEQFIASRLRDDFELRLQTEAPAQAAEAAIRRFGALLAALEIRTDATTFLNTETIRALVRHVATADIPPGPHILHPEQACDLLHLAIRTWTTEVRPQILEASCCGTPDDECILLATLHIPLDATWRIEGEVQIDETERPLLMSTRLLQEWLLCGRFVAGDTTHVHEIGGLSTPDSRRVRLWLYTPDLVEIPPNALILHLEESPIPIVAVERPVPDVNVFDLLIEEESLQEGQRLRLQLDLTRIENPATGAHLLEEIEAANGTYLNQHEGGLVTLYGLVHLGADGLRPGDTAGGDLDGTYPNPTVRALQGHPVTDEPPNLGDLLTWTRQSDGTETWSPQPPPAVEGGARRLGGLDDVDVSNASDGQVIVKQGNLWLPVDLPSGGIEGTFVQIPATAEAYAIVAAGIFEADGTPGAPPYNDLRAIPQQQPGRYLLIFPHYALLSEQKITLIVKGTPMMPNIIEKQILIPTFNVEAFTPEGILVTLGVPTLTTQRLREALEVGLERNILQLEPVATAFMVEVSAYGVRLTELLH